LIEPLDLSRIPNFDASAFQQKFMAQGTVDGKVYAVPKNWGTTGMLYDTGKLKNGPPAGKSSGPPPRVRQWAHHGPRLSTHCHRQRPEKLRLQLQLPGPERTGRRRKAADRSQAAPVRHQLDIQPSMRSGDAWLAMSWTGDASQLHRDNAQMQFSLGKEGGELWSDFFAIPKNSEHKDAAYAFINYLLDPQHNKLEVLSHGYPSGDKRVDALLPTAMLEDPIMYPAAEALSPLEFGAAATLTSPARAELMARFKSA
jgi:spermidine/putrescine transport system substrate-binding protein